MSTNKRSLRSPNTRPANFSPPVASISFVRSDVLSYPVRIVAPGSKLPGLSATELRLLRQKQERLKLSASSILERLPDGAHFRNALEASLIFAQEEAGSAVCVGRNGWFLTCSHCFGDSEAEWKANTKRWLLFYTGLAVQIECLFWDSKRDLALCRVVAIEIVPPETGDSPIFCYVALSAEPSSWRTPIICIGQPGGEDLESEYQRKTNYNLIEISQGVTRGMVPRADPHDNSEIGTLKHDAWTYWGHSGAPLLREEDGTLIGLHSSWDDKTSMRHGIPHVAIVQFLKQNMPSAIEPAAKKCEAEERAKRDNLSNPQDDKPKGETFLTPIMID